MNNKLKIDYERWESDEYVVTVNGRPVGQTRPKGKAKEIVRWLKTAIKEILEEE